MAICVRFRSRRSSIPMANTSSMIVVDDHDDGRRIGAVGNAASMAGDFELHVPSLREHGTGDEPDEESSRRISAECPHQP